MITRDELTRSAAVDLAAMVKRKRVSPLELVDSVIAEIERVNPRLNAIVAERFTDARKEARAQNEVLAAADVDDLPPFFGVPFTVKECFGVKGLPHTVGNLRRKGTVAERSAPVVVRLQEAGAIPVAVTNMPEMAMGLECANLVYGRTNNPHDITRTSGGSSGGEGAIVGAGASPFGVASDVGGSIRMPSLFCGTFGHKPSGGLVPGTGHVPQPSARAARFTGYGPIARSARDLFPILSLMAGPDGVDPGCLAIPLQDPRSVRIDKLVVHTVVDDGRHDIAPDLRAAQARAARALEARGARVEVTEIAELREAFDLWGDSLRQTADRTFGNWVGEGAEIALGVEWGRALLGKRRHTDMALFFVLLERVSSVVPLVKGGYPKMLAFKDRIGAMLGDNGVLLLPPFPSTAPKHGQSARTPRGFVLSGLWNMLEMPSTSVPIARDGHGMPTGTQVIGPHGADGRTIAVALALDEDLRGYQPPSL